MNYRLHWIVDNANGHTEANDGYLCPVPSTVERTSYGLCTFGEQPKERSGGPRLEPESTERDRPAKATLASSERVS